MKRNAIAIALSTVAVAFEALPFGAVLNFAQPDGEAVRRTYSYFSLVPFGYANVAPLFTAVLTCVLLLLTIVSLFKAHRALRISVSVVSAAATVMSLLPLLFGIHFYSFVGALITLVLLVELIVSLRSLKH
jgi:hypothetical protein